MTFRKIKKRKYFIMYNIQNCHTSREKVESFNTDIDPKRDVTILSSVFTIKVLKNETKIMIETFHEKVKYKLMKKVARVMPFFIFSFFC